MTKITDAIKNKLGIDNKPPVVKCPFDFSFEFEVIQYPNTVIGKKQIVVNAENEDDALNKAAEILNSELEDDQHLRYTQKFTKKDAEK